MAKKNEILQELHHYIQKLYGVDKKINSEDFDFLVTVSELLYECEGEDNGKL